MSSSAIHDVPQRQQQAVTTTLRALTRQVLEAPLAIGVDIVDVADFERLPFGRFSRFYSRCFSEREIVYCRAQAHPSQHFAARFAAKEAAVKALSSYARLAYWQIEVERESDGRPALALWTLDRTSRLRDADRFELRLSLSHTEAWAAAVVVAFDKENDLDAAQAH